MKHKKFVRFVCLMMAVLMVLGVMGGVLSTMAAPLLLKRKLLYIPINSLI